MKALTKNNKNCGIVVVALILFINFSGFALAASKPTSTESDFINILNAQRISLGENSLAINSSLSTSAYLHSKDMAENNYFSHTSLDGTTYDQRIIATGYTNWTYLAENIDYYSGPADANIIYNMWKNSPDDYANMIGDFNDAGLGVYTLNNITYATLDLGKSSSRVRRPAAKLSLTTQPSVTNAAGVVFGTQPVVNVQDALGVTVSTYNGQVTLSITAGTGSSGAALSGTATVTVMNGVATFSGLSINLAGTGYILTASSSGLTPATSTSFNIASAQPAPTPSSPANGASVSGNSITYSWNTVAGATAYSIYVSTSPGFSPIKFNQVVSTTTATDTGYPNNGTTYYWLVYAWNGTTWSPASTVWAFSNGSTPAPTLISPANNAVVSGTSVKYSWNAVPGATAYSIYVSTSPSFSTIKFNLVTSTTSTTDTGYPNNGTTYYWQVYAWNGAAWGPGSMVWAFNNGSTAAPTLISPSKNASVSGTSVNYSWNAVPGATAYSIYVSTSPSFSTIKYNQVVSSTSATDTGYPNNGATYYWLVFEWNGAVWSPGSAVRSFINGP